MTGRYDRTEATTLYTDRFYNQLGVDDFGGVQLGCVVGLLSSATILWATFFYFKQNSPFVAEATIGSFMFVFTTWVCTASARWQTFQWVFIKICERLLWTGFVYFQKESFLSWSDAIHLPNQDLESIIYIAVLPIVVSIFMFLCFSRIHRMRIPCIDSEHDLTERNAVFNFTEVFKIGVLSTLMINVSLWIIALLLLSATKIDIERPAMVLFMTMIGFPFLTVCVVIFLIWALVYDFDDGRTSMNNELDFGVGTGVGIYGALQESRHDFLRGSQSNSVHSTQYSQKAATSQPVVRDQESDTGNVSLKDVVS